MLFRAGIRLRRIGSLTNQCYYHHSSITDQHHIGLTKTRVLDHRAQPYGFVRFFAAPVLATSSKPEPKQDKGTRLNEKITSDFVRLVEDDRHEVVSRRVALDRAKKLKLDLVEVDRTAKPPVCKIMDYHKEKYKRQTMEKEKAKSKTEGTLRKGSPKEIRFTDKTEKKDLQTKAETAKRLMEKGYRVKCMAVGKEDQDLGGMLARLSALIEDVAVVESGPMVEKKQAYVLVRHMKFGPTKKGSGKKNSTSSTSPADIPSSDPNQGPLETEDDLDERESRSESEDDIDHGEMETLDRNEEFKKVLSFDDNKRAAQVGVNRYSRPQGPAQVGDNRYSRQGATNTVPQGPGDNRYSGRNATNTIPQGHGQVGDNRYSRQGATNTVPQGPGDNRYSGRSATNTIPQGHGQVGDNRYSGRSATNMGPQGHAQVGDNRYSGRSATNRVPQGPAQVGDNRYSGRNAANTVPQGPGQIGDNRYSGRSAANTVPQGPGQIGDSRYSGRSAANTVPQGPAQVGDNRYSGRGEIRGKFHPTNSREGLADVTKLSEFTPIPFNRAKTDPTAINSAPYVRAEVGENRSQPSQTQGVVPSIGNFSRPPTDGPVKREPLHPTATEPKRSSFGIFSASKNHTPSGQTVPTDPSTKVDDDQRKDTGKWGNFGR